MRLLSVDGALALFEGKRIVHVKGFESGLDFDDVETAASAKSILSRIEQFDIVVWDGGDLRQDSFTAILERASAELVAFKLKNDKLDERWNQIFACVEIEDRSQRLGVAALGATRSRCVLCLGGDRSVAEDALACSPEVTFHVFDCGRWTTPDLVFERSALARGLDRGATISSSESAIDCFDEVATSTRYFLASNNRLVVKTSVLLPAAGLGLFTAVPLLRGQHVCDYVGDELSTIEAMRLRDKSYLMRLGPQSYVDARKCLSRSSFVSVLPGKHLDVYARYINDPRNARAHNVVFVKLPDQGRAMVHATRFIARGEELYASYGKLYWAAASARAFVPDVLSQSTVRDILSTARSEGCALSNDIF